MVFTFLKACGISVGKSFVEDDQLELAKKLEKFNFKLYRLELKTVSVGDKNSYISFQIISSRFP
jgi:3-phosphoglycerate kinase